MYTYNQKTGEFRHSGEDDTHIAFGYSGHGEGKNNPSSQHKHNEGPIPCGLYTIGLAYDDQHGKGPIVMKLTPDPENEMFGRSGFLIHGDNATHTASEGCLILVRSVRETIDNISDKRLRVFSGLADASNFIT